MKTTDSRYRMIRVSFRMKRENLETLYSLLELDAQQTEDVAVKKAATVALRAIAKELNRPDND